jgi:sterol desaturase/sphingolipid hydroxylase (fatty acid hydroxylase superfamily)
MPHSEPNHEGTVSATIISLEPWIRFSAFAGCFLLLWAWEVFAPRSPRAMPRSRRWPANIGMVAVNTALTRLFFPVAAVGVAVAAEENRWGLLHAYLDLPHWLDVLVGFIVLDLAIYLQHVLFHSVPALWRLHRMHHADLELDLTTGARFHPIEIMLSIVFKAAVVLALGAPALAVVLFEILLNATSMFNHANIRIPPRYENIVRAVVVTPDMHCIHHSIRRHETNSNFGFNLPVWDRLFGTYRARPEDGDAMTIGIESFRSPDELRFHRMLTQPFRNDPGEAGG